MQLRLLALIGLAVASEPAAADPPSFSGLGIPGGYAASAAKAVSRDGRVVAGDLESGAWPPENRAATWEAGAWSILPLPVWAAYPTWPAVYSTAVGVSATGGIVAGTTQFFDGTGAIPQPTGLTRWESGAGEVLAGGYGYCAGISDSGERLAGGTVPFGPPGGGALVVERGVVIELPHLEPTVPPASGAVAISRDGSTVIGWSQTGSGRTPCRWIEEDGVWRVEAVSASTRFVVSADALSDDGSAIAVQLAPPGPFAVGNGLGLWRDGDVEVLSDGFLSSSWEQIRMSADATTVTAAQPQAGTLGFPPVLVFQRTAAGWTRCGEIGQMLEGVYGLSLAGWTLTSIDDMTPDGSVLVGTGINPRGETEGWIARLGARCPGDCDCDAQLTVQDFLCFQNRFAARDPGADCDGDGTLTFFDFLCFQNAFAAGCP